MPSEIEIKQNIKDALSQFNAPSCSTAAKNLLNILGYHSDKTVNLPGHSPQAFLQQFNLERRLDQNKAIVNDWSAIYLVFQLTETEVRNRLGQQSLFQAAPVENTNINSFLFFTLCLRGESYTRTQLASITREINKLFLMPVIIFFSYNQKLSLGIITHRMHRRDANKDVLEKVTLIKDVQTTAPHRAHLEVLFDLSMDQLARSFQLHTFKDLQTAWQKTLDVEELNKKFYKEIANWYFWAVQNVKFPVGDNQATEENRNAINVIRLITRLIFVWFLKEKQLVPEDLFNEPKLRQILKDLDPNRSTYYQAILQNLFFATLNQEMNTPGKEPVRKFRSKKNHPGGRDGHRLICNLYRYETHFKDPQAALQLFENIPFLNGGLFECLDKEIEVNGNHQVIRIDGFSDETANPLCVPNELFFGAERDVDLNKIYDTSNKKYRVQGLVRVLESYKFTVEENTPITEEVALDPELLGKVFENLLAAYNPETSSTARKATGSYYTPRPIVEYMVDESLVAYLKTYLQAQGLPEDPSVAPLEERVRDLISYTDSKPALSQEENQLLVKAIDELNVLDPACGSGAFPMGILLKLVHILQKLDPDNQIWQEVQLNKAVKETEEAYKIGDQEERHQRILDIEEAFDNNTSDYGRKLYLIESCLYGVDIQPIAVQVAKLRFFISLIVDQKPNPEKENLGIRPLPNLETKFVAANSLLGLQKPDLNPTWLDFALSAKESELAQIRHKLFSARTIETKRKYRTLDKETRYEIRDLLLKEGWNNQNASRLADWDPYDQNASASFFDPEWMMGVKNGFDIVLGNPPYIQLQKDGGILANLYADLGYETYSRMGDIYCLFYDLGRELLREGGHLCFITSNKWMRAGYGEALRKFLAEKTNPKLLIDFAGQKLFESVTVDNNILLTQKGSNALTCRTLAVGDGFEAGSAMEAYINANLTVSRNFRDGAAWVITSDIEDRIRQKIEALGTPLGEWDINIYYGVKTGYNEAFIVDGATKDRLIREDPKSAEILKPVLRGRDIKRYRVDFADLWLIFVPWHFPLHDDLSIQGASIVAEREFNKRYPAVYRHLLGYKKELSNRNKAETGIRYEWYALQRCAATYYEEFEKEKIVWAELARTGNSFILDRDNDYTLAGTFILTLGNKDLKSFSYKYLVAMLNHPTTLIFLEYVYSKLDVTGWQWKKEPFEKIPIPRASQSDQKEFIAAYDALMSAPDNRKLENLSKIDKLIFDYYGFNNEEILFTFRKLGVFKEELDYFQRYLLPKE